MTKSMHKDMGYTDMRHAVEHTGMEYTDVGHPDVDHIVALMVTTCVTWVTSLINRYLHCLSQEPEDNNAFITINSKGGNDYENSKKSVFDLVRTLN